MISAPRTAREAVEIAIYREAGANIVELAEAVKLRIFGDQEQRDFAAELEAEGREGRRQLGGAREDRLPGLPLPRRGRASRCSPTSRCSSRAALRGGASSSAWAGAWLSVVDDLVLPAAPGAHPDHRHRDPDLGDRDLRARCTWRTCRSTSCRSAGWRWAWGWWSTTPIVVLESIIALPRGGRRARAGRPARHARGGRRDHGLDADHGGRVRADRLRARHRRADLRRPGADRGHLDAGLAAASPSTWSRCWPRGPGSRTRPGPPPAASAARRLALGRARLARVERRDDLGRCSRSDALLRSAGVALALRRWAAPRGSAYRIAARS